MASLRPPNEAADDLPPPEPYDESDAATIDALVEELHKTAAVAKPKLAPEPLFSLLLRDALADVAPDDEVLADYARHVAPQLSALLAHVAAKGGNFAVRKREGGTPAEDVARYADDQSMRAHIINGLLPTAQVARTLQRWGARRFEDYFDARTYRLFCAGFTLHDWLKLPDVDAELRAIGLQHHTVNVAVHLADVERIVGAWCERLGLDTFLAPIGPLGDHLHDLLYIASNTQLQWGVMHNLSALPGLRAPGRNLLLATDLATLADYLAYLGRTPVQTASHPAIVRVLESFHDQRIQASLTYHHLADVRGVITSIVNNVALKAYAAPELREPLLYAPTGVVYLTRREAPPAPQVAAVAEATVERIRTLCQRQLSESLAGFGRDGKGIKYADYYTLFFSPRDLARIVARFAERRIVGKTAAQKRYDTIASKGMVAPSIDLALPDSIEVDRIAESCALLVKLAAAYAPTFDADRWLLWQMGLAAQRDLVRQINSNKTAGGVPYGWYYAAGVYRRSTLGLDEQQWVERLHLLAEGVAAQLPDTPPSAAAGWDEIRRYVADHLRFGGAEADDMGERLKAELARYSGARKSGRGATTVCALCSSPYSVSVQQEAAILFAPMVYTNKQPLHGSKAIRHICAVCGVEMMLRQLLMKRGRESGKNFEGRKLRYLFLYPTYFFTPETLRMVRALHDRLKRISFTALRGLVLPSSEGDSGADLSPQTFQRLQELMLHPTAFARAEDDRLFRLRFPDADPVTFSFIGIPPAERDAKDAEAWINPAFLALVLPLLLDVKVVASESMLPTVQEATELSETVAFDAPHPFVSKLIDPGRHTDGAGRLGRLNLDELLPALQRLTAAYLVHMEGNAKMGAAGYDYRWHEIPALARNLATSPLYTFYYLKKAQRREGADSLTAYKASLYVNLVEQYLEDGSQAMSHARNLVLHYRRFYRHKKGRLNSNNIVRPLSEAAKALLTADLRLFDDVESLYEVVRSRLEQFTERVGKDKADGTVPTWLYPDKMRVHEELHSSIELFARYFVETIYRDVFKEDRAALAGRQLNLLKNACESIYLAEQRREWRERGEQIEEKRDDEPAE